MNDEKDCSGADDVGAEARWKKKFKGRTKGGAWIHIHPLIDRAIVENHHGFTFNGVTYNSLDEAKTAALFAYPNASDCDKQGWLAKDVEDATKRVAEWKNDTTKSEGGVQEPPASNPDYNGVKSPALVTAHGLSGQSCPLNQVMPDPSDRTADVTVEELDRFLRNNGYMYLGNDEDECLAQTILDKYKVGRR